MIARVGVPVATLWTGPDAPRDLDADAVADRPDIAAWTDSLDSDARAGLHGRVLTQLLSGEEVDVIQEVDDWAEVVARWQPSSLHADGYPGWLRRAHLAEGPGDDAPRPAAALPASYSGADLLQTARGYLGLAYLWGGTSRWGVDCSGLVHLTLRAHGVMVPRDAHDQQSAAQPVDLGAEQPGDLYFFARPDRPVHHVGFVVEPGLMLHAPETGALVVEEALSDDRLATRVGVGRFGRRSAA